MQLVQPRPALRDLRVPLALAMVYLVWGSGYTAIKWGLQGFPPFLLAGLRNLLAAGLVAAVLLARGQQARPPDPARRRRSLLVGLLIVGGGCGGGTLALGSVSSGVAALAFALVPVWAVALAALGGTRPSRRELAGLGLGVAAVALLGAEVGLEAQPGGLLALLAGSFCWAAGTEVARREATPFVLAECGEQMLAGGLVLTLVSLGLEPAPVGFPGAQAWLGLLYLAVFASVVAYGAYLYLIPRVSPGLATSHAYVNPLVALALGWLVLGEALSTGAVAALLLTLPAVWLLAR